MLECAYAVSLMLTVVYVVYSILALHAECRYAECHYTECSYAECHNTECPVAQLTSSLRWLVLLQLLIIFST